MQKLRLRPSLKSLAILLFSCIAGYIGWYEAAAAHPAFPKSLILVGFIAGATFGRLAKPKLLYLGPCLCAMLLSCVASILSFNDKVTIAHPAFPLMTIPFALLAGAVFGASVNELTALLRKNQTTAA